MSEKNIASAVAYYQAMNQKKLSVMEKYLHPEVRLISPLAEVIGKEYVLGSIKHFFTLFDTLAICDKFGFGDRVMLTYELNFPAPIGVLRAAVLITFQECLITRFELFYDPRPFEKKRDEIFAQS